MNENTNCKGGLTMDICGDNRFEIIEKAKQDLLESTNISSNEDEIKVLDRFLFRCWQMGWLDKYNEESGCEVNFTTKDQADLKVEMQYHKDIENAFKGWCKWQKEKMNLHLQTEYEKGLFDMQQAMMKNAVDCVFGSKATSAFVNDFPNIEIGDKVKIIFIKEDEICLQKTN